MMNPKSLLIALFTLITINSCKTALNKNTETKNNSNSVTIPIDITNKIWKITVINSEAITGDATLFYLKLNSSTSSFESKAGCNQINGKFQLKDNYISFSNSMATKMYCFETMKLEDSFLSILEHPSKYVVVDSTRLILLKDDMVIAQFELVKRR